MTISETKLAWAAAILAALLLVVGAIGIAEHTRQAREIATAQQVTKDRDKLIAAKEQEIASAQKRIEDRDKVWHEQQQALTEARAEIHSVSDALKQINRAIPATQKQVLVVQPGQLPKEITEQLPDAPSYVIETEAAAVKMAQATIDLQLANAHIGKLTADNADLGLQLAAAQAARQAAEEKATSWQQAAKGGTTAQRIARAGKWMLVGGGIVAAVIEVRRR